MVIYNNNNNSKHFIGSIVYKFEGTISSTRVIIDGQQRLTTLYLLCKAIYDLVEDDERFKWRLEDVLKNGAGDNTLVPIKTDNEVYSILLENNHDLIKPGTSRIHENYIYFKNRLVCKKIDLSKIYELISNFEKVKLLLKNNFKHSLNKSRCPHLNTISENLFVIFKCERAKKINKNIDEPKSEVESFVHDYNNFKLHSKLVY